MPAPSLRSFPLFAAGLVAGVLAYMAGLPMPFLLGGLAGAAIAVGVLDRRAGARDRRLPPMLRTVFVALVGVMIGSGFSPELLAVLPALWPSALAVLLFIVVAHAGGYWTLRRVGGYRPVEALYAAMPGGLVEASLLGERAGADVTVVAVQHFIRIILVVVAVPLLFLVLTGEVVGSAGGQALNAAAHGAGDIAKVLLLAPAGLAFGRMMRLPAWPLIGPMALCAALQTAGLVTVVPPPWLLHLAQLVIGVGLGAQFSGFRQETLLRGLGTGLVAVGFMLALSFGFALALARVVPADAAVLFLAFAPGGVTEMNLIALSLNLSPVIVAVHHLIRIVATVFMVPVAARAVGVRTGR